MPKQIQLRPPTTDTYSLEQSQEEFYFVLSLDKMDLCLYGKDHGIPAADMAPAVGTDAELVERVETAASGCQASAIAQPN